MAYFRSWTRGPRVEREGQGAIGAEGVGAGGAVPPSQKIFQFSECNLEHRFKVCLQQKTSHQTSMHCACRFFVKIGVCDARGPSPNAPVNTPLG